MDDDEDNYEFTLALIDEEFRQVAYKDEDILQIFKDWDEFVEESGLEWKDVLIHCYKDTILRMRELLMTKHKQLFTTTLN